MQSYMGDIHGRSRDSPTNPGDTACFLSKAKPEMWRGKHLPQLDSASMGNHPAHLPAHMVFTMRIPLGDASPGNVPSKPCFSPFPHILSNISQSENMEIFFNKKKETLQIEKALPDEPSGF